MSSEFQSRWYVVQTHPHAEAKAVLHLGRQGYRAYLPRYRKRRRHARRVDVVAAPLFPGYLFVAIDVTMQRWRSIQSTIGISRLLCHGDEPIAIENDVIDQLRSREDGKGMIELDIRPNFTRGDKLRILDGVFTACLGLYEGMTDQERVAVLLDLFGRKVRVYLDAESVAAA